MDVKNQISNIKNQNSDFKKDNQIVSLNKLDKNGKT